MLIWGLKIRLDQTTQNHLLWNTEWHRYHGLFPQIIRSLRILGLEKQALAFYHVLTSSDSAVGQTSRKKFERAARKTCFFSSSFSTAPFPVISLTAPPLPTD